MQKIKKMLQDILVLFSTFCLFWLAGCPEKEYIGSVKVSPPSIELFCEDIGDRDVMLAALKGQEKWFIRQLKREEGGSSPKTWTFGRQKYGTGTMLETLRTFMGFYEETETTEVFYKKVIRTFDFYKLGGREADNVLFTGYYTPIMSASRSQTDKYRYPIYKIPDDMFKIRLNDFGRGLPDISLVVRVDETNRQVLPYYTREEIDWLHSLEGRNLEIAWLEDYIDQFFLHIQGGGILDTGEANPVYVNYAGKNGHPFIAVGRLLLEDGKIDREKMSMQAIRLYFRDHPDDIKKYCIQNKSYVFYEEASDGPYGSLNLIVTPGRSIATDKRYFPGGSVCLIAAEIPVVKEGHGPVLPKKPFSRFVLDQDTGGAIRERHIDLYCGAGEEAALQAGSMKSYGDVYMLLLKEEYR